MTVNSYIAKGKQEFRHLLFRVCASWRPLVATLFFFVLLAAAIYSLGAGWMPAAVALAFAATWLLYYLIDRHSDYVNDRIVSLVLAFVVVVLLVIAWRGLASKRISIRRGLIVAAWAWSTAAVAFTLIAGYQPLFRLAGAIQP